MSGIKFSGVGSVAGAGARNGLSVDNGFAVLGGVGSDLINTRVLPMGGFGIGFENVDSAVLIGIPGNAGFVDGIVIERQSSGGGFVGLDFDSTVAGGNSYAFTNDPNTDLFSLLRNGVDIDNVNVTKRTITTPIVEMRSEVKFKRRVAIFSINFTLFGIENSNEVYINNGAGAARTVTLFAEADGIFHTFIVGEAFDLIIAAGAGESIRNGTTAKGVGGNFRNAVVGSSITFLYVAGFNQWVAISVIGTWV